MINHYPDIRCLTTKRGLTLNLKNLIWWSNTDVDEFFPRCFDLTDNGEMEDFAEEFKSVKAESVVKTYMGQVLSRSGTRVRAEKLRAAMAICERRLLSIDDIIDAKEPPVLVNEEEWSLINADKLTQELIDSVKHKGWFIKVVRRYAHLREEPPSQEVIDRFNVNTLQPRKMEMQQEFKEERKAGGNREEEEEDEEDEEEEEEDEEEEEEEKEEEEEEKEEEEKEENK